jgi:hypothetical protein
MITFVQIESAENSFTNAQVVEMTVAEGNSLIIFASQGEGTISSITDNGGNTYELASSVGVGFNTRKVYIAKNINGGTLTITMSLASSTFSSYMRIMEFTETNTFNNLVEDNVTLTTGVNNISYSVTNAVQPALLLYWETYSNAGFGSQTWDASYTNVFSGGTERIYYKVVSTTGAQAYSKTFTTPSLGAGVGYTSYLSAFYYVTPPRCVKIRGKCKLRGKIQIR